MKQAIKLGVVCLARKTFDFAAAGEIYARTKEDLRRLEQVEWVFEDELVIEIEDAHRAAQKMSAHCVDAVVVISGTFHLGHLALIIDRAVQKPVLLWAFEELPYDGGKIRLNSVCGLNLNASNLYKAGNDTFVCHSGSAIDESWVDAVRMKAAIEKAHIGLIGFRAHGFFNLGIDELRTFRETGMLLDHYEISDLLMQSVSDTEAAAYEQKVRALFSCGGVNDEQVNKVAYLCASAEKFMQVNKLTAAAVRCWPEHAAAFGIAPCAMMSVLQSLGIVLACEGDVEAAMTMLACKAVGVKSPFMADLSQVNFKEDFALMWHCGVAPADLWDGCCERSLDTYFAGGKGVTADFVMKSGEVSILRFDSARGKTRVFHARGEAKPMEKLLKGTYAKVVFEHPVKELLDTVAYNGVAHHVVLSYGDFAPVYKIFARIMQWERIEG